MRRYWKELIGVIFIGILCPAIVIGLMGRSPSAPITTVENKADETLVEKQDAGQKEMMLSVLNSDGSVEIVDLDEYLTCVVLQEMPASFETEALKAQAVVARTYALRRKETGGKHPGADICKDSACCQGFCSVESYLENGGTAENVQKVNDAVKQTHDQILTYRGKLIEATYFSCSGGMTEDAVSVWGSDIPYLKSTESPGEENATYYTDTVTFTADVFLEKLGLVREGDPENWLEHVTYTQGGGVETMWLCGVEYSGTTLRRLLGLRSTAFVLTAVGNTVTITTKGFGHRVGMSQYGADAMAVQGKSYRDILLHYYIGTDITTLETLGN